MPEDATPASTDERKLNGQLVVPILGARFDLAEPIDDEPYSIVPMDDCLRDVFSPVASMPERDSILLGRATHALVIGSVPAYTQGGKYESCVTDDRSLAAIERFFGLLAIETRGPVNFGEFAFIESGRSRQADQFVPVVKLDYSLSIRRFLFREDEWTIADSESAHRTITRAKRLESRHARLKVAAQRLYAAQNRMSDEDYIVDLCIALEAILGSGFSETVHRLCMRAAAVLVRAGWGSSASVYKSVRDVYAYRSRVVHGDHSARKKDALTIGGAYIHASRYALAATLEIIKFFLEDEEFDLDALDDALIFSALDLAAPSAPRDSG